MTQPSRMVQRAAALGLLARGFAYPVRAFQEELARGSFRRELLAALAALEAAPRRGALVAELGRALEEVEGGPAVLEGEYTYLFARTVASPPNETSYGADQTFQRVRHLSDIAAFYAAFGFQVAQGLGELPDHVGVELEFLAVLYVKEAYARRRGWGQRAQVTADARQRFLKEHLGRWVPSFVQRLRAQARLPFYPALAAVAESVLAQDPAYAQATPMV